MLSEILQTLLAHASNPNLNRKQNCIVCLKLFTNYKLMTSDGMNKLWGIVTECITTYNMSAHWKMHVYLCANECVCVCGNEKMRQSCRFQREGDLSKLTEMSWVLSLWVALGMFLSISRGQATLLSFTCPHHTFDTSKVRCQLCLMPATQIDW